MRIVGPDPLAPEQLEANLPRAVALILAAPPGRVVVATRSEGALARAKLRAFRADRAPLHAFLRARGLEVIVEPKPWPDAYYDDGVHFSPEGAMVFRRWLGEALAKP